MLTLLLIMSKYFKKLLLHYFFQLHIITTNNTFSIIFSHLEVESVYHYSSTEQILIAISCIVSRYQLPMQFGCLPNASVFYRMPDGKHLREVFTGKPQKYSLLSFLTLQYSSQKHVHIIIFGKYSLEGYTIPGILSSALGN